jgi:hydrogenase maturation protease
VNTIVVGLGNPILGDDGVGWQIVQRIQQRNDLPDGVEVDCLSVGGISLMERLIGYQRAILIDSFFTNKNPIGTLLRFSIDELPDQELGHIYSAHDTTLQNALQVGRQLGAELPDEINIVAVEAQNVNIFSEQLSPEVAAAVPGAVQAVMDILLGG